MPSAKPHFRTQDRVVSGYIDRRPARRARPAAAFRGLQLLAQVPLQEQVYWGPGKHSVSLALCSSGSGGWNKGLGVKEGTKRVRKTP